MKKTLKEWFPHLIEIKTWTIQEWALIALILMGSIVGWIVMFVL